MTLVSPVIDILTTGSTTLTVCPYTAVGVTQSPPTMIKSLVLIGVVSVVSSVVSVVSSVVSVVLSSFLLSVVVVVEVVAVDAPSTTAPTAGSPDSSVA